MKTSLKLFLTLGITPIINTFFEASAQELPQPSPMAKVEQMIGLTNVSIAFSRPGVKGRKIWGDLVPYNEMWRTGANKATIITFSDTVMLNGQTLPAGNYSLSTIPTESEWTIIFNKDTELWGTGGYKKENDALRIKSKQEEAPFMDRMMFSFENLTDNSAELALRWDKVRVAFKISANVDAKVMKNIEDAIAEAESAWTTYRSAARYCAESKTNLDKGMVWIDKSLAMKGDSWYSWWVKAQLQAAKGAKKEAIQTGEKAIAMGVEFYKKESKEFTYKKQVEKDIAEWKK